MAAAREQQAGETEDDGVAALRTQPFLRNHPGHSGVEDRLLPASAAKYLQRATFQ
jgi:hypothetical protein